MICSRDGVGHLMPTLAESEDHAAQAARVVYQGPIIDRQVLHLIRAAGLKQPSARISSRQDFSDASPPRLKREIGLGSRRLSTDGAMSQPDEATAFGFAAPR
jgi:hypothetical protein